MIFPLVRELAAAGAPVRVPVAVTCRVLGFSRQAYYAWLADPVCAGDLVDADATNAAIDAHGERPGARVSPDLRRARRRGPRRVRAAGAAVVLGPAVVLGALGQARRGPPAWPAGPRRPGLPQLHRHRPEPVVADRHPPCHRTDQGKVYCCAVKDVYSGRIVGYSISDRMKAQLAVDALTAAVARRGGRAAVTGCVVHSDRGSLGGFNRSSQHLDVEVARWATAGGSCRCGRIGDRSPRRDGRRWRGGSRRR
jgi:putative transposase